MSFEILDVDTIDGEKERHVVVETGDNSFVSFPAVEGNPAFDAFIAANPDALKNAPKPVKPAEKTPSDPAA
jgi:hypothetical protein